MARPSLPKKKEGDGLSAYHVNELTRAAEQGRLGPGSNMSGISGSFSGTANRKLWEQRLYKVTKDLEQTKGSKYKGMYEIQPMYYDFDEGDNDRDDGWVHDEDAGPYELDTLGAGVSVAVDDVVTAYFDVQRDRFVPVTSSNCMTWIDAEGNATDVPNTQLQCGSEIEFALEGSANGSSGWRVINQRVYALSWTEPACEIETTGRFISGTGIYSFGVFGSQTKNGVIFLRIPVKSWLDDKKVDLTFAALRIKAMCGKAIAYTTSAPLADAGYATNLGYEQRASNDTLSSGSPKIEIINKYVIRIDVPKGSSWSFQAELACKFYIQDQSSSSQQSTSSPSSASSFSVSSSSSQNSSSSSESDSSSSSVNSSSSSASSLSSDNSESSSQSDALSSTSQSSSGFDCYDLVSNVTFDENACELTVCKRTFCWPKGTGPNVGGENCS